MNTCHGCTIVPQAAVTYNNYKTGMTIKTATDVGLALDGKKTTNDMLISTITGKDCKLHEKLITGEICY